MCGDQLDCRIVPTGTLAISAGFPTQFRVCPDRVVVVPLVEHEPGVGHRGEQGPVWMGAVHSQRRFKPWGIEPRRSRRCTACFSTVELNSLNRSFGFGARSTLSSKGAPSSVIFSDVCGPRSRVASWLSTTGLGGSMQRSKRPSAQMRLVAASPKSEASARGQRPPLSLPSVTAQCLSMAGTSRRIRRPCLRTLGAVMA
jgi:hypothetical protein